MSPDVNTKLPDPCHTAWQDLAEYHQHNGTVSLAREFSADRNRVGKYCIEAAGLYCDFSKNLVDDGALVRLFALARASGCMNLRDAMFKGEAINTSEQRAALHVALRGSLNPAGFVGAQEVLDKVAAMRARAYAFANQVRDGNWHGHTGRPIRDIVNIGIGGSDLGPRMAVEALKDFADPHLAMHFVANVDPCEISDVLDAVDPATTLFIVASKTFTTQETLANACLARDWLLASGATPGDIARHFVAVSTNAAEVSAFGIAVENMFGFWDWVGGRYSIWSSIGLSLTIAIGPEQFDQFLAGARAMDQHFADAPLESSMPVVLALLDVWYRDILGAASHAVLPYSQRLARLPAYLQQLEMESNGKSVTRDGNPVSHKTCGIIWGEPGTNGQHAFFQLLHQGTELVPIDFIVAIKAEHGYPGQHRLLLANCLAQASALMCGKSAEEVRKELSSQGMDEGRLEALVPQRVFAGNRPSTTILMTRLEPATLGALVALYEHKVLIAGALWNINSFDQWGVELGKVVANRVAQAMEGELAGLDPSTRELIARIRRAD
jgi:glucose-6-phosphate isomerase